MNTMFKRCLLVAGISACFFSEVNAQDTARLRKEAEYTKMIIDRSDKIVAKLGISDSSKYKAVRTLVANQYRDLNNIYEVRDADIKALKAKNGADKAATDSGQKIVEAALAAKLAKLHPQYLAKLGSQLTPKQVEMVKDGMTYSVCPITYKGYQDMIPTLTEPQKAQILAWLVEAREYAMDAESSDKKHAWFGKYKGRINNYLSEQGYDAKKEREEWEKRLKAAGEKH